MAGQARGWNRVAKVTAVGFLIGSVPYLIAAFTCGLLSGLIVLMVPLYAVLLHVAIVVIALAVSLAQRRYGVARVVTLVLALVPATAFTGWYAREWWRCEQAADSAACFEYLNGSPLLPITVAGYAIVSLTIAAAALFVIQRQVALERAHAEPALR